jgi:type I restriction enzyme S subunit
VSGWQIARLDNLCTFQRGLTYSKAEEVDFSNNAVLRANNIDLASNKLNFDEIRYISDTVKVPPNKKVRQGSLLICTASGSRAHLGKVALIDTDCDFAFGGFMGLITPNDKIDSHYLYYALTGQQFQAKLDSLAAGSNINNLKFGDIADFEIPIPPLEEQRRIVAVLDEAFAAIAQATANAEKNLANARELFEATLREVFAEPDPTWELLTLRQAALDFGRGKSKHRPRNDPKLYGGPYPFIQTGDVRNCDHIIYEFSQSYNEVGLAQSKLWPKGTICITIAANIAETGILGFDACFPDSVIGIVVDPARTSNNYVEFLLQSLRAILQAKGKGSAQANLNLAAFENEHFPFPPIEVQLQIVHRLEEMAEQVREMETIYSDKLSALVALKQSLLHRAFTGELATTPELLPA